MKDIKLMMYSLTDPTGLCSSYIRAAQQLEYEYLFFDYEATTKKYAPFGKWGMKLHFHLDIQSIHHKVNREFVLQVKEYRPSVILFFTNAPVSAGALLFIKSILPSCKLVLVWPDSMLNVKQSTFLNLQLFDCIASYSDKGATAFRQVAKANVLFTPLAGDLDLHQMEPTDRPQIGFGFVGGWRPERERCLNWVVKHFGTHSMEIHGQGWKERTKNSPLSKHVKSTGKHGKQMAAFFNTTTINLNIIDDTNYPAANMRFFEIPTAGGLQLSSDCPEMESIFLDGTDLFYFSNESSFVEKVNFIFSHEKEMEQVKRNAYQKICMSHNYKERLSQILNQWQ